MKLIQNYVTKSDCYKAGRTIGVKGLMIHSVGCPQPLASAFINNWNKPGADACVHAIIEPDGDVYQLLPWNHRGWHGGGSCNDTHIGVEMTEPSTIRYTSGANWMETGDGSNTKTHVLATYKYAVELFAYLCKQYSLNPLADGVIISHSEGHKKGIASNHGDVEHIWTKLGLSMTQFRKDIQTAMSGVAENTSGYTKIMGNAVATAEQMEAYIKAKNPSVEKSVIDMIPLYLSEGQTEGVRGDIAFAQSCLETGNFTFSGSAVTLDQNNFCGMGVTSNGLKGNSFKTPQLGIRAQIQHLKAYASTAALVQEIIDPRFQYVTRGSAIYVEWLGIQENPDRKGWAAGAGYGSKILTILKNITGTPGSVSSTSGQEIKPMSGYVHVIYKGEDGLNVRTEPSFGDNVDQVIHEGTFTVVGISADGAWYKLKSGLYITTGKQYVEYIESLSTASDVPFQVKVDIIDLNIRTGAGTNYAKTGHKTGMGVFTIVEVKSGVGSDAGWGRLKSGAGWISLDYVTRI